MSQTEDIEGLEETLEIPYVIPFDHRLSVEQGVVGGKAASLGRLVSAGFPVPPGFSVTTSAYVLFMQDLNEAVSELLGEIDYADAASVDSVAQRIRALILDRDVPSEIASPIVDAYAMLGGDGLEAVRSSVAVRSSGTAEDLAEASFAGMHDTYLDIYGDEPLLDAVKRCWASLWTARVVSYRHDKGFSHTDETIAVIVQQMVASEVSGVMFTANPLNARTDEIVVNASWGLGEGIVSGLVTPDDYVIDVGTLEVKKRTLGSKELKVVKNLDRSGTVHESVPPALREVFCLSDDAVTRLAELGRDVMEYHHGLPQDLEWAYADGQLYLLQARPVTGVEFTWDDHINAACLNEAPEDTIWTSAWCEQFLTGGITPLFFSLRPGGEFQRCHNWTNEIYGLPELVGLKTFKYHRATGYFNCNFEKDWNIMTLPGNVRLVDFVPPAWEEELKSAPWNMLRFLRIWTRLHVLEPKTGLNRWLVGLYDMIDNRIDEANGPTPEELRRLSDDELRKAIEKAKGLVDAFMYQLWAGYNLYGPGCLNLMAVLLQRWYDGPNETAYQDLCSGLPDTNQVKEARDQWHLANEVRRSAKLQEVFDRVEGAAFFTECENFEEGRAFLETYREFLQKHGHRGHQDRDIYYTRRIEDPGLDYQMIKTLLMSDEQRPIEEIERAQIEKREQALQEVLDNISKKTLGGVKAEGFKLVWNYVHKFLIQRDDERHYLDRLTFQCKKVFAELGRRMDERGLFHEPDDFYFLAEKELYDLLEGRASRPLCDAKILARKAVFHRRNRREEPTPPFLKGGDVIDLTARGQHLGDSEGVLHGFGTAAGRATATARVVPNLPDMGRVEKGDILVCNSTDPGWTPVFSIISGLVLETGGMLSHGACLSREYGIPAVQLRDAVSLLPDGHLITIDGTSGEVFLDPALATVDGNGHAPEPPVIEAAHSLVAQEREEAGLG